MTLLDAHIIAPNWSPASRAAFILFGINVLFNAVGWWWEWTPVVMVPCSVLLLFAGWRFGVVGLWRTPTRTDMALLPAAVNGYALLGYLVWLVVGQTAL